MRSCDNTADDTCELALGVAAAPLCWLDWCFPITYHSSLEHDLTGLLAIVSALGFGARVLLNHLYSSLQRWKAQDKLLILQTFLK